MALPRRSGRHGRAWSLEVQASPYPSRPTGFTPPVPRPDPLLAAGLRPLRLRKSRGAPEPIPVRRLALQAAYMGAP